METTSLFNNPMPSSLPLRCRRKGFGIRAHSHNFKGKLVDESMIVLRRRIHELTERKEEPPLHWMEWEKKYKKANYDVDVCEAVGYLQSKLMETRPSLALGMALLFLFSLPTSLAILVYHVMHTIKG